MQLQIEKGKDGTYTSRLKADNRKLTGANQQANTKQGAYKNLCSQAKGWLGLFCLPLDGFNGIVAKKAKGKKAIEVVVNGVTVEIPVKEINC